MSIESAVFYLFSGLALLSAAGVILSKNSVRALLSLIVTFFSVAGLWMLLQAEFLGIALVLVYVGAVMVLFLFVVMMLDVELAAAKEGFARSLPLGLCVAMCVLGGLAFVVGPEHFGLDKLALPPNAPEAFSNTRALGELLYGRFLYPFELAGLLLLIAIISAISLTLQGSRQRRWMDPSQQVAVQKLDRVRLVKMESGKKET